MAHFGSTEWNNPCGMVMETTLTGLSLPSGTNASTTIANTTYTAPRRGLYRVNANIIFTTGTTGTFTPQIVSTDDKNTITSSLSPGATPSTNALFNSFNGSSTVANYNLLSKVAFVQCKAGGTINLAFTTTTAGSGGVYNVYYQVIAV